ncbi:hypothetical protein GETHLI_22510 [Geothrix limicola]|uniref:Phytanoyl-CoA dioxygenase n=1 Tax=Geothrix limicola TaxID=2927978 RepID=A0ABQ5QFY3_9BACT|nr:sporadic carbohydrate cluster 2OG-Fe(II) oxygenase [Geothrix limicola]GLH73749.1 hypothetical protein GETHLI_22510 [Geothrix limicola]
MGFFTNDEAELARTFLTQGHVLAPAADRVQLDRIRQFVVERTAAALGEAPGGDHGEDPGAYLDGIHTRLDRSRLNELRLGLIEGLRATDWFREAYFACGRPLLEALVGNELVMQRGLGLSIQLPGDESSLLPLHSDVWSEDSPFEVVLWIPLVDCFRTKSMFILPPEADARWRDRMHAFAGGSAEAFTEAVADDLHYLEAPYGTVLCFTHTLMHGNRVNREPTTRWSLNVRFKGLFTPYSDKQLGDFFDPITLRPATRIGMGYRMPGGFGGE